MSPQQILLALSFIYPTVYCDIVRTANGGFRASFEVINIGRMYKTLVPVMKLDVYACAVECIRHPNCITINHNHETNLCELVDQNYDEFEADTSDPDWANYGTGEKIDGSFTAWNKIGTCSVTCGIGTQIEQRSCDNPEPRYGGKVCDGKTVRQVECNTNIICPTHGAWSSWRETGFCSRCVRKRTCNNPSPKYNGLKCLKLDNVTRDVAEIITPCKPCEIADFIKCRFVRGYNLHNSDSVSQHNLPSDKVCAEFCYEQKKTIPGIVGLVTLDENNKARCWCKTGTVKERADGYKYCIFEGVSLAQERITSQSSTHNEQYASLAVDGDKRTWSRSDSNPSWWIVEMRAPIILRNMRLELSADNLVTYTSLKVSTKISADEPWKLCKSIETIVGHIVKLVCNADKETMKYIRIENDNMLLLHEVYVYGWPTSLY